MGLFGLFSKKEIEKRNSTKINETNSTYTQQEDSESFNIREQKLRGNDRRIIGQRFKGKPIYYCSFYHIIKHPLTEGYQKKSGHKKLAVQECGIAVLNNPNFKKDIDGAILSTKLSLMPGVSSLTTIGVGYDLSVMPDGNVVLYQLQVCRWVQEIARQAKQIGENTIKIIYCIDSMLASAGPNININKSESADKYTTYIIGIQGTPIVEFKIGPKGGFYMASQVNSKELTNSLEVKYERELTLKLVGTVYPEYTNDFQVIYDKLYYEHIVVEKYNKLVTEITNIDELVTVTIRTILDNSIVNVIYCREGIDTNGHTLDKTKLYTAANKNLAIIKIRNQILGH